MSRILGNQDTQDIQTSIQGCSHAHTDHFKPFCVGSQRGLPVQQSDDLWSVGLFIGFEVSCQSIVAQLQAAFISQQEVGQFKVAVHYPAVV